MCADREVIISWHSFDHPCPRSPSSPPAEHPHNHRHHPADNPAGPGADRRDPLLSHLTVLELLLHTFGAHAPALRAIAPCGQSLFSNLLRPPAFKRPDPGLELLVRRPSVFSRSRPAAGRVPLLHPLQRPTDPFYVPVRLVRPSSRVVFSLVIQAILPRDYRRPGTKRLTVTAIFQNLSQIRAF